MTKQTVALVLLAGLVGPGFAGAAEPLAKVRFSEPDESGKALELLAEPASYDRASSDEFTTMAAAASCSDARLRGIDLTLSWEVTRPGAQEHRVDLTMFSDGFETGRYTTSGPRPAGERGLILEDPLPGVYYYWRLLTRTADSWRVSGAGRLDTPVCVADEVPE